MTAKNHLSKWIRLVLAAAMAVAVGVAIVPGGTQAALVYDPAASGGSAPVGELTRFEIDGDRVPGVKSNSGVSLAPGVNADWQSTPYGPQPIGSNPAQPAPAGIGSSGLLPLVFADIKADDFPTVSPSRNPAFGAPGLPDNTVEFCVPANEDSWVGGTKVTDVSIDNPLYTVDGLQALQCGNVLGKGDLFSVYTAYETIAVPNVYGNPDAGSQNHVIVYGAWERGEIPGELNFYIPISDAVAGNSAGDRLIAFDYDSSSPAAYRILAWDTGLSTWVVVDSGSAAVNGDTFAAAVGFAGGAPFSPGSGAKPSFGEFALDLTATDILPDDSGPCVQLQTAGFVFTETGNSATAQLKDYVGAPRIPISNCGPLSVTKAGPAGVTNSPDFDFRVEQQDSLGIFETAPVTTPASTTTQYNDRFVLGETVTLQQVISAPDYLAFEEPVSISGAPPAALPTGWEMVSVDCTYINGFAAGYPEVTERLYLNSSGRLRDANGDLKVVQVHSSAFYTLIGREGYVPNCVIANDAAGIIVAKQTLPDGAPDTFDFTVAGGGASSPSTLGDGDSSFHAFDAGTTVTITESNPGGSPAWNLTDITCLNENGSAATTIGETATSVTLAVGSVANTITCTFTNTKNGSITVDKAGLPGDATQGFNFTVGATPVGPLTIPGGSSTVEVAPGTYTVTELEPPVDADWVLVDIVCGNEANQNLTAQSVDVTVAPGQNVNCTFTNNQRGPVTITKSAELVSPAPVAGTINQFDVRYTVTAESASYVPENIVVTDAFAFPATLSVVSGPTVSGAASTATWNGDTNTELFNGSIAARGSLTWTIDVRVELDLASLAADRDCNAAGSGAWNDVEVAVGGVKVDEDDACVSFGDPSITIDKTVVGAVTVNPDRSMSVTYSIDVANVGDGPGAYDLTDSFGFPAWVNVTGVAVANTAPGGIAVDATFDGAANTSITAATTGIGAGATHTYTVTVDFTAAPTATAAGADCALQPTTGNGLFNLGTVTTSTGSVDDPACIDIPRGRITVTKATFGDTDTFGFSSSVPGALINGGSITTTATNGTVSGNTLSAYVTPGSYTVTETPLAGWTQIATPCGAAAPAVVTDGGSTSCDFTNGKHAQVTVSKIADPSGSFDFTLTPGSTRTVASGSSTTWTGLDAGSYTLAETVVTPWQLIGAACDNAAFENGGTLAVDWGDDIDCVFTNEALAEIIVEKQTLPDGSSATFEFSSTAFEANPTLGDGDTASSGLIVAGDYIVTELAAAGWDLTDVSCVVTDSIADPDNGSTAEWVGQSANISLAPGDTVTCSFTNTQRGQIVVNKTLAAGTAVGVELLETFDFAVDGTAAVGGDITDESVTLDANGDDTDGTPSTHTIEVKPGDYSVVESVPADWELDGVVCTGGADASDFIVAPGATVECTFTNSPDPADVTIDKTVVNVAADYAWSFDFTIAPTPAGQAATQAAAGVGPDTVQIGWTALIPGQQYTITETVPANWTQSGLVCDGVDDGDATDNSVTFTATPGLSLSCSVTNTPDNPTIVVRKTTVGGVGAFDFEVTPENDDDDLIKFSITTVTDGVAVPSTTYDLLSGLSYDVDELAPGSAWAEGTMNCGLFGTGTGGSPATITVAPGDVVECSINNSALGNITVVKDTVGANGTFEFTFDGEPFEIVTVANTGIQDFENLQPGDYTIVETDPTADFDGTALSCASSNGDTETVDLASLTATVNLSNGETVVCTYTNTERAHILVDKVTSPSGDPTSFTFTETWTPDGGSFQLADAGATVDSGLIPSNEAYTLVEDPLPGWVVTGFVCTGGTNPVVYDVDVNDADGASATITPAPGETVLCTVTNTLLPVDLELTKDDGGFEAIAGGAPIPYTISVRNVGDRDADLGEPVTVTDELPAFLSWNTFPATCAQAGQILTCDIDPADMTAGGDAVVIQATVNVAAGAPSGDYENRAWVDTEDDPVCEGEECTPPPCPATENNNVDCEETPVDRVGAVQITKTDNVATGASVQPGDTFTYTLVVKNTGVSTLLPGTHVADDLPAQLTFVSAVGGAGWTCNAADPVDCDYAAALAPGETAPPIVVTVRVAAGATGATITNVAVVLAAVDRDCPTATDRLVESFIPACNQVTDDDDEVTPLVANADLAIVKTASVEQVGAGGSFNWTLAIVNNGPGTAFDVVIGDLVPAALTVTGVASNDFTCGRTGNQVTCTKASLAVGAGGTVTISVSVPSTATSGTVTNVGNVSATTPDPVLSNNSDDASVDIVAQAVVTTTVPVTLPPTGSDGVKQMVTVALLLAGLGVLALAAARRRQDGEAGH